MLLATYNGEKYVKEQISSVLNNFDKLKNSECTILISDDGSTDNTVDIIKRMSEEDPRILFLDGNKKGGVKYNFNYLIQHTDADYVFFCDQDDLWLPNKMHIFMDRFNIEEVNFNGPILVHSDLCVADNNLSPINVSMFDYQMINKSPNLAELLVSNSVTGCVMACNKKLIDGIKLSQISNSIMHDWYIALYASSFGVISFVDKALILYRQHGGNQVGAKSFSLKDVIKFSGIKDKLVNARRSVLNTRDQSALFISDFGDKLSMEKKIILESYINFFNGGVLNRMNLFFYKRVRKTSFLRNLVFFLIYVTKI
ncbi:glycosyltransferase family 2 protein [Escherichia coli]|uniref:glycosyltransferase family 2 protein n=1 Tax=Escherichia coli TaxID=562 RepID=UPI0029D9DB30|nr:glycosyltransferase family 2 protein [Escherichia coli]MDX7359173.1 glycosyltransferase family 2 protein [Escherichia coli]